MRLRFAVLGSVLTALLVAAVSATAGAAPRHNNGLTINATPNPIIAGEGVLLYGQLNAAPVGAQTIVLYHHVAGSHQGYTPIGRTTTDAHGFYEFPRAEGVVETNRSWFAREVAGQHVHSRTVYERVSALVSLAASTTNTDTNHPIVFTGHVDPPIHASERVYLQEQRGAGDHWMTLATARLTAGSNYSIAYRWRVPGVHDVRVVFRGDFRNIRGESDPVTVTVQQAQMADFTISSSAPIIPEGSMVTISGVLSQPNTTTPEPSTSVTLWGRSAGQPRFTAIESTSTGADGSYRFTEKPTQNTEYVVRTTFKPHRHSAVLFEGVRDVLTLSASPASVDSGQPVTFTGAVTPDKAGDVVYLQRLGADGEWHTVGVHVVKPDSTFEFVRTFGTAGTKTFRARIPGDPLNVGGASGPVTITVTVPPPSSLAPVF
jgi:hypothetical protein